MKKLVYVYVACMLALLAACGTSGRQTGRSKSVAAVMEKKDTLTYEQRRKYDYYFLEAVRMKQKGEYDAAFELYKHCLDINPNSAPALYEISQFYMFSTVWTSTLIRHRHCMRFRSSTCSWGRKTRERMP